MPVEYLTTALDALQEAIYLLAMQEEGRPVRKREKADARLAAKYALRCGAVRSGSVVMEGMIGDPTHDLTSSENVERVLHRYFAATSAIAEQDAVRLQTVVPDSSRRAKFIQAFRRTAPKVGSGWVVEIAERGGPVVRLTDKQQAAARALLSSSEDSTAIRTLTGRLTKIDFDNRRVTLFYPVTSREIECSYGEELEVMLLKNPRELIQVTGTVVLDAKGLPERIREVESIEELDLNEIEIRAIPLDGVRIVATPALRLAPELDETEPLIILTDLDLGIDCYAATREALIEELRAQLAMLWSEYALAEDEGLTEGARRLKVNLRARFEEEPEAKGTG